MPNEAMRNEHMQMMQNDGLTDRTSDEHKHEKNEHKIFSSR
jgi:hypothetical protein